MKVNNMFPVLSFVLRLVVVGVLLGCSASEPDPVAAQNAEKGKAFLEENKHKQGVITLPSGLQYVILKRGNGHQARITDSVTVHFRGMHLDGSEFDNSYKSGKPVTVSLKAMIPGWKKALLQMSEGAKWRLFVPPYLAYTNRGSGSIKPNETLIYEIELLKVNWRGIQKQG